MGTTILSKQPENPTFKNQRATLWSFSRWPSYVCRAAKSQLQVLFWKPVYQCTTDLSWPWGFAESSAAVPKTDQYSINIKKKKIKIETNWQPLGCSCFIPNYTSRVTVIVLGTVSNEWMNTSDLGRSIKFACFIYVKTWTRVCRNF